MKKTITSKWFRASNYDGIARTLKRTVFALSVLVVGNVANAQSFTVASCSNLETNTYGPMNSVVAANSKNRTAFIIPASKITGLVGGNISAVYFKKFNTTAMPAGNNFKIYLKNTSAVDFGTSALDWTVEMPTATLVYDADPATAIGTTAGYKQFLLSTGFAYSGANLEVLVEYTQNVNPTAAITWNYEYTGPCVDTGNSKTTKYWNGTAALSNSLSSQDYRRPLIAFDVTFAPCVGAPSAGTASPLLACAGQNITLATTGVSAGLSGLTYQWQSSPAGANTWSNVAAATTSSYTLVGPATATDYRLTVSCAGSGLSNTSGVLAYTVKPANQCFCTPTTTGGTSYAIANFTTSGAAVNINNTSGGSAGYQDFFATVPAMQIGQSTSFSYSIATLDTNTYGYAMWIDYNQNGTFEATEQVLTTNSYAAGPKTGIVAIPASATLGTTRLRVMNAYTPNNPTNPCVGSGGGEYEDYAITILPPPTCLPPTGLVISNLAVNAADLTWTAATTVAANGYDYYISTSSVAPIATTTPSGSVAAGVVTQNLGGLNSNTTYFVWVRSKCSASDLSSWSASSTFKTLCSIFTVPYAENFDTTATGTSTNMNAPSCWKYLKESSYLGYGYVTTTAPFSTPNVYYLFNSTSTSGNGMLVSPPTVGLSDGTKQIRFMAKGSGVNYSLEVGTVSDITNAASYTAIGSPIVLTTSWAPYTVNIPAGTNQFVAIRHGNAGSSQSIYLDDILVQNIPTCIEPTNVSATAIATNSATITWTDSVTPPSVGYDYYYATVATPPTAATAATGSVTAGNVSAPLSGLTANTSYFVWVRSVCSSSDKSIWSMVTTFKTACGPIAAMNEGFEAYATGNIVPDCWVRLASGATPGSQTITTTTPASGVRNIYQYATATQTPVIVILPIFSNIGADTHRIRFKARVTATPGSLSVGYVTDINDANTFTSLQELIINNTAYTTSDAEYIVNVPSLPANARIAIMNKNDGKSYYWDDIKWEDRTLGTSEIGIKNSLSLYPNPFVDVVEISDITKVKSIKVTDMSGKIVKDFAKPMKKLDLSGLVSGMYMVVLQMQDGTQQTIKAIKK